jgi:Mrp family chromosome partitioning ATPase
MKKSSTARRADEDLGEQIITAVPRVGNEAGAGFLARLTGWATRTRAQEADTKQASLVDEVTRRPSSSFSAAILDIWDVLGPPLEQGRNRRAWTVLVTSLSPGVGKTTIAANLARVAGEEGARALLIEANPANPQIARMIEPNAKPGLIDLVALERLIYEIACEGDGSLHVVPIMPSERRIVRRLAGRRDVAHFDGIANDFDFVAIDGPSAREAEGLDDLIAAADRIALVVTPEEQVDVESFVEEFCVPRHKLDGLVVSMMAQPRRAA